MQVLISIKAFTCKSAQSVVCVRTCRVCDARVPRVGADQRAGPALRRPHICRRAARGATPAARPPGAPVLEPDLVFP